MRAAAERLGVAKSQVSRAVAALEARLGMRLFERSHTGSRTTDLGRLYYAHCRRALDDLAQAEALLQSQHGELAGTLRVSAAVVLGPYLMGDVVADFMARHPKASVISEVSDRLVDLVPEGVDLAVRIGGGEQSASLVTRRIARPSAGLYASPAYLREAGMPATPQDLLNHRTLDFGPPDKPAQWLLRRGEDTARVRITPVLQTNDIMMLTRCAVAGQGICLVPHFVCREQALRDTLQPVLPDWQHEGVDIRAAFASHRSVTPLMRAFIDLLADSAPALLDVTPPAGHAEASQPGNGASLPRG